MGESLTFEKSLELREISPDVFQNVHRPWVWPHSGVLPGGILMSMSAAAAYRSVPDDFAIGNLHTEFMLGSSPNKPFVYKLQRLSSGKRFAVRIVTIEQDDRAIATVTLRFIKKTLSSGPTMKHSASQVGALTMKDVLFDDLIPKSQWGPWMKFQRLSLLPNASTPPQAGKIAPSVARIWSPIIAAPGSIPHILGIVNLSDYHVLDAALTLHGITFGLPEIGSEAEKVSPSNREATKNNVKLYTSLNHSIHFHVHTGFRADDITYIEVTSPWARDGRAMLHSSIFSKDGTLIATCSQEGFYALNDDAVSTAGSKL